MIASRRRLEEEDLRVRFRLSRREATVALKLAEGLKYAEIAAELGISFNTVATHVKSIFDKTGVSSSRRLSALIEGRTGERHGG